MSFDLVAIISALTGGVLTIWEFSNFVSKRLALLGVIHCVTGVTLGLSVASNEIATYHSERLGLAIVFGMISCAYFFAAACAKRKTPS